MPSSEPDLGREVKGLMTFRVVVTTALLVCTFVIELLFRPLLPLQPFYVLAIAAYVLTLGSAAALRTGRRTTLQAYAQLAGDAAIVSGFVYLTGGVQSPFSFLYLPGIVAGCLLLPRRGGVGAPPSSWSMEAALAGLLQHRPILPPPHRALH